MNARTSYAVWFKISIALLMVLFLFACSRQTITVSKKIQIKEKPEQYEVFSAKYCAFVDKATGYLRITDENGKAFSGFPLAAQFEAEKSEFENVNYVWQMNGSMITLDLIALDNSVIQRVKLDFRTTGFEIQFGVKVPDSAGSGVYCGKRDKSGFDQSSWIGFFSPEPDEYYKTPPTVDVSTVNDKQWIFSPAPLNLSIETTSGWFSVGLAKLGHFTRVSLSESAIWLNIPWKKVSKPVDDLYWISPLIFTFPESEWHSVGAYRKFLIEQKHLPKLKNENPSADWWLQPVLSTRGEQNVEKITDKNPAYSAEWVKEYITQQTSTYEGVSFTIIIGSKWQEHFGDSRPSARFAEMRKLIDWCHEKGHKVVLSWKSWLAEANSLAQRMDVTDGDLVDATHDSFKTYIQRSCAMMLSSADTALNADGLKIEGNFLIREPENATYFNANKGMGLLELKIYLESFYTCAKKQKSDALIIGSAQAPQFQDVQDVVSINEDWDDKLRREKRARIISQALPDLLILGDAADMASNIAMYHFVTSSVYGIPCIEYTTQYNDGPFTENDHQLIKKILKLYSEKGRGRATFIDYGWWQWRSDDRLMAESVSKGSAYLHYASKNDGAMLSTDTKDIPFLLDEMRLVGAKTEDNKKVEWQKVGDNVYRIKNGKRGTTYKLKFRKSVR